MLKVVDLVYYFHEDYTQPSQVVKKHAPALGFAAFLDGRMDLQFVKHMNAEKIETIDGHVYAFFKSRNQFWWIPFETHRYIRNLHPDVVIIEGLIFPIQLIVLRLMLGGKCRIVVQHHGEKPFKGIKKWLQKIADRFIDMYLFTSRNNADGWVKGKIISDEQKVREILEASTNFIRQSREESRDQLAIAHKDVFIWVGHLDANKDPITVVRAFTEYAQENKGAILYMIYQAGVLINKIEKIVDGNLVLKNSVVLVGEVDHAELPTWFSAADYYISGSHKEGSGYALLEAMSCGCIPIVTAIPSFIKITGGGEVGFLYKPGDVSGLKNILQCLDTSDIEAKRDRVERYFKRHLHFRNIADDLYSILSGK